MTILNLIDFKAYDNKSLYEYILLQETTDFMIRIPRKAIAAKDNSYEVFDEYIAAAFIGQKLGEVSQHFAYDVPGPGTKEPFQFKLTNVVVEKFIDVLDMVIHGMYDTENENTFMAFHTDCAQFFTASSQEDFVCYTWGLVYLAEKFFDEI